MGYTAGDWIVHNTRSGSTSTSLVIETGVDGSLVVGMHPNDPDTTTVFTNDVIGEITGTAEIDRWNEGDTVKYTTLRGNRQAGVILAVRPDEKVIIGENAHDGDAIAVDVENISEHQMTTSAL